MTEIHHKEGQGRTFFVLTENGNKIGTLAYTRPDATVMVIQHTVIDEGHDEQKHGTMLVEAAAHYARQNNLRINPLDSFAKGILRRSGHYTDILI